MKFMIYMLGYLIIIGGLAWGAITAGAPQIYVIIGAVILFGLGIVTGISRAGGSDGDVTVVKESKD